MKILFPRSCSNLQLLPIFRHFANFSSTACSPPYLDSNAAKTNNTEKNKNHDVVVIMGPTGSGKSKLSIDLSTRISGEVLNSDKIQVYKGLDITTNKLPIPDRHRIPHHLLGDIVPLSRELTATEFRSIAHRTIVDITARRHLPVLAGGSNSFIHAALVDNYSPNFNPFSLTRQRQEKNGLRYRCCLLWVDVEAETLAKYLDKRVDEMINDGMVTELEAYFAAGEGVEGRNPGLEKAIGVAEFREYFATKTAAEYDKAVAHIKLNTRRLAVQQAMKIERLGEMEDWELKRIDATAAVLAKMNSEKAEVVAKAWEKDVLKPSLETVLQFLE